MIRFTLTNSTAGGGYSLNFKSNAEVNRWIMYVQEELGSTCFAPDTDGRCTCHIKMRVENKK